MIGFFKKTERERRDLIKAVNLLTERMEDLGEYRQSMPEVFIEATEELGTTLSGILEVLKRIEVALASQVKANEAMSRYFVYETKFMEKQNEELSKPPGRHDDIF